MQNRDIYLMILGMTLVTYLPWCFPVCLAWMPTRCWGLWGLPWQVVWHGKSVPSLCACWPPLRWKP